jgi:hypothetical protein
MKFKSFVYVLLFWSIAPLWIHAESLTDLEIKTEFGILKGITDIEVAIQVVDKEKFKFEDLNVISSEIGKMQTITGVKVLEIKRSNDKNNYDKSVFIDHSKINTPKLYVTLGTDKLGRRSGLIIYANCKTEWNSVGEVIVYQVEFNDDVQSALSKIRELMLGIVGVNNLK